MRAILALGLAMIAVPLAVVGGALVALATFLGLLAGNLRPKEGTMNNRKMTLSFLALVGWAVMTVLITGCAPKRVPVVWANLNGPYLGFTTCDTTGQVVILLNASDEVNMADYGLGHVLLHEQIHVTQVEREGSCKKFMQKYNEDKKFAFDIEAEAYCGELEFRVLKGASRVTLFANLVRHMKTMAPFWSPEQVAEALPCSGGPNEKGDPDTSKVPKHP